MDGLFSLIGNYFSWNVDNPNEYTTTENGDKALVTSGSKCLNFFTRITRSANINDYVTAFFEAMMEDYDTAIKLLLNLRDIRGGKGEKLIPIVLMVCLKLAFPANVYSDILKNFIDYGCWKDLLRIIEIHNRLCLIIDPLCDTFDNTMECQMFANQLALDYQAYQVCTDSKVAISLCAKWAPGERSHFNQIPIKAANKIMKMMNQTPKEYRVMLSDLRAHLNILERLMSTGQYELIDFKSIPSIAMKNMKKSFSRDTNATGVVSESRTNLHLSYSEYLKKLSAGETKVNVKGIQPHELVSTYLRKSIDLDPLVEAQWNTLVQKTREAGSFSNTIAIVDTSGSMDGQPLEVAVALGILVAECSDSADLKVLTFNTKPRWHHIEGSTLQEKVKCMDYKDWGGSTDLRASFQLILDDAIERKLDPEDMISSLIIFTDMQFDSADGDKWESTFETVTKLFNEQGYELPKIVCWNLRTSDSKSLPIDKNEEGYIMLSGFSAELLKHVLNGDDITPMTMMMTILEPYNVEHDYDDIVMNKRNFTFAQLTTAVANSAIKKGVKPVNNI
uniref:TROVE domain-containing protein n=1 Tax=viral metagenome TaxID=1070528 RepID=A0A6C0CBB8_9ZZZZ